MTRRGSKLPIREVRTVDGTDGRSFGPLLYFRGAGEGRVSLAALVVRPQGAAPPVIVAGGVEIAPLAILSGWGLDVHRYAFDLPARGEASYRCDGEEIPVSCDHAGDLRIAFVSCNGQEKGDLARDASERNAMWRRLCQQHREAPFHLLLQGGDQIYADEVTEGHPLSAEWPRRVPGRLAPEARDELYRTLLGGFVERYAVTLSQPDYAWIAARVPSLAMWDDHDICDGWGSLREEVLRSDVGQALFAAARTAFLVFQQGEAPDETPAHGLDPTGASLGWAVDLPGLRIVAPDLRSERSKARIMGEIGWRSFDAALAGRPGRLLFLSTVPALGPRLSLVEALMLRTPWAEKYEDDLRDQWQSRAHREEWRELLSRLVALRESGTHVTVVSGEIHLATRGTMATRRGPVHQLVASGISHPAPPRGYARALGTLARLGEAPLAGHPIRLKALPGHRAIYTAERNYLVIERRRGIWTATWQLEDSGPTRRLVI